MIKTIDAGGNEAGAKLFTKMMTVLNCFTRARGQLSISEIVEETGLPRTTVHRIVASLRDVGMLDQDGRRQTYRLGLQMFYFGSVVIANLDLTGNSRPHILSLHQLTGEAVHLHIFDGSHMVCIEREEMGENRLTTLTTIEGAPTYCTSVGKAFLAFQDEKLVNRIATQEGLEARTEKTITDLGVLKEQLVLVRNQGYAIDDEENEIGIRCVGAPIRDSRGHVFAAVSVSGTTDRMPMARVLGLSAAVVNTADSISKSLGWNPNL
ncbi:IclR family transcriptional regulator [uncultured Cohaesibacter sp.]|uniref:IclR family transcriptional regulator n=1 Tax=uncultured Cohaesibacter sp. TaxID=1002546 RepID=UPI0029C62FFB|nr:IclR family transcriptional regulator [uncultured Cohaesibacter sp.]